MRNWPGESIRLVYGVVADVFHNSREALAGNMPDQVITCKIKNSNQLKKLLPHSGKG